MIGHWLGWTHFLDVMSITWPGGRVQPVTQTGAQALLGLWQALWQSPQALYTCPSIGQDTKEVETIITSYAYTVVAIYVAT